MSQPLGDGSSRRMIRREGRPSRVRRSRPRSSDSATPHGCARTVSTSTSRQASSSPSLVHRVAARARCSRSSPVSTSRPRHGSGRRQGVADVPGGHPAAVAHGLAQHRARFAAARCSPREPTARRGRRAARAGPPRTHTPTSARTSCPAVCGSASHWPAFWRRTPRSCSMDEPLGALDAMTRDHMHDEIERVWAHRCLTVLFVTHNMREAVRLGDRVVLMCSSPVASSSTSASTFLDRASSTPPRSPGYAAS